MKSHWTVNLEAIGACEDAVEWARGYKSFAEAWEACERADWLAWLVMRVAGPFGSETHRRASALVGRLAATAPAPKGEKPDSPRLEALGLVERYGRGEAVTRDELRAAAYATYAASAAYAACTAACTAAVAAAYAAAVANRLAHARLCGMIRDEYGAAEVWAMVNS